MNKKNILIGITSSIASYKIYELIRLFKKENYNVKTVLTKNALNFVSPLVLKTLSENSVYYEEFNPDYDTQHINLTSWADVFVVAPLSANTLSKFALGIADNLLTSVFCAYLGAKKPVIIAPAMNNNMYNNPIIQENLSKLKNLNCEIVEPEIGFLACGETGVGRLADINLIFEKTIKSLNQNKKNNSKKMLITIGGTKEKIDSVRYITNSSSGKMGTAIADWAYYLGYDVTTITTVELKNKPYKTVLISSADEMLEEIKKQEFDILIMAAAVSDFKALNKSEFKISKEDIKDDFCLKLTKNPDIIKTIAQNKKENQKIIGFCLTDKNLTECAKNKLINKNLDYIIANDVKSALNTNTNEVTIISKSGKIVDIKLDNKKAVAKKILEAVCD